MKMKHTVGKIFSDMISALSAQSQHNMKTAVVDCVFTVSIHSST